MLRVGVLGFLLLGGHLFSLGHGATEAAADGSWVERTSGQTARIITEAENPGSPAGGWSPSACFFQGQDIPCSSEFGHWNPYEGCYATPVPGPQNYDHAEFAGRKTGRLAWCSGSPAGSTRQVGRVFWEPDGAFGPSPAEVAQTAVDQMNLRAIDIGKTPLQGAAGVVGIPVWLWVATPTAAEYAPASSPRTSTATAGAISVTAQAYVREIRWGMGDGGYVTCSGPGVAYSPNKSSDCQYKYSRPSGEAPGGHYTLQATTFWVVDWAGAGQTGSYEFELVRETEHVVGEIHVLKN